VDWSKIKRFLFRAARFSVRMQFSALKCVVAVAFAPSRFRFNYPSNMKKLLALLALAGIVNFAAAADAVGNAKAAENKTAMCVGCHGIPDYKATFPEVFQVPKIGGQSAKYIENALKAYQKGERKNPSMRGIAGGLSDQDMADLAAYYSQQK
jgi:cytochrome c553